jgi:hypothetical protein
MSRESLESEIDAKICLREPSERDREIERVFVIERELS